LTLLAFIIFEGSAIHFRGSDKDACGSDLVTPDVLSLKMGINRVHLTQNQKKFVLSWLDRRDLFLMHISNLKSRSI